MAAGDRFRAQLEAGARGTSTELSVRSHCAPRTARKHAQLLHRARLIHISEWRRSSTGVVAAVWAWGDNEDKPKEIV